MTRYIYIVAILLFSLAMSAQKSNYPQRTATDIALKQTKMLVDELNITDTLLCHRLFQLHLKYAQMRDISNTRNEALQRMMQLQEELKNLLSPEQFEAFINRQLNHNSRIPRQTCNWIAPHPFPHDTLSPTDEEAHTPQQPSESQ